MFRPEFLPWREVAKQATDDFYKSEQAQKYIKNYQFKSWRDLKKKFALEIFDYDMIEALQGNIKKRQNIMLFAYEDDKISYQQIQKGDIAL